MFQNKNNAPAAAAGNSVKTENAGGENFPIHTMKKDLEEIKNPSAAKDISSDKAGASSEKTVEMRRPSPFVASVERKPADLPIAPAKKTEIPVIPAALVESVEKSAEAGVEKEEKGEEKKEVEKTVDMSAQSSSQGKIIAIVVGVLVVLILAGSGYYFWATRQLDNSVGGEVEPAAEPVVVAEPEPIPEPVVEPEPVAVPTFTIDKPNYLNINLADADGAKVKAALQKYADSVMASGLTSAVEFSVVDENNNPLTFQDFAAKAGMKFSTGLAQNLDKNFSLFIYNDQSYARIGLSIASKDAVKLKTLLAAEETNLPAELDAILLASVFMADKKQFSNGKYGDITTKYFNFTSEEPLSIDYAIIGNDWVIGTTMMTMRLVIDYKKAVPNAAKTGVSEESAVLNSLITP